jgi:hypothetical protein
VISKHLLFAVIPILALTSCKNANEVTQVALDAIADKCQLDRSVFRMETRNTVRIEPFNEANLASMDCALREIDQAKFSNMSLGFVGNEEYGPEQQNNAQTH